MRRKLAGLLAILILVWALPALGEEAPTFDTLDAAGDFLRQQADQGAAEATFRVIGRDGSDLDNEAQRIREMAGVYSVSTYVSGDQITAKLTCYPGSRIYHAAATGDAGGLDAEEYQAMGIARQAAQLFGKGYLMQQILHQSERAEPAADQSAEQCAE